RRRSSRGRQRRRSAPIRRRVQRSHTRLMLGFPGLAVVQVVTTHSTAPDGLALAGINGTILAILIAALSGYALIVFQSLDRMQTDLIDHANQINSLPNINRTSGYFETEGRDS